MLPQRHIKTGEIVAIKRLYKGKYRDGINVAAVCEVQVLQELHHPNIIKVRLRALGVVAVA